MNEMLLLGAGASAEAGVPTAYRLTNEIAGEFRRHPRLDRHSRVVSFVLGGLLFNRGIQGGDPLTSGVNVEEFFNAIQLLADRNSLEAAPFVGSWHSLVEEFDKLQPPSPDAEKIHEIIFRSVTEKILASVPSTLPSFGANDIDRKLGEVIKKGIDAAIKGRPSFSTGGSSVGREVGDFVVDILKKWTTTLKQSRPSGTEFEQEFKRAIDRQPRPGDGRIFREVADQMIRMLAKFVLVKDAARVEHLRPLKNLLSQQPRLTIATLNYDNCLELFCKANDLRCDTGIDEWSKNGIFEIDGEGVLLLKLHGSIDWKSEPGQSSDRPMPHQVITRISPEDVQKGQYWPAVIFGHRNKLTADGPFLDLLRAFQRELEKADRLTIVGYSFADVHINVFLSQWLNGSPDHRVRIVNPSFAPRMNEYADLLQHHAKNQIDVITDPAGVALKSLFFGANSEGEG